MLSENIKEYLESMELAQADIQNHLIELFRMLIQRETQVVEETISIKVAKGMLLNKMKEVGIDTSKLEN